LADSTQENDLLPFFFPVETSTFLRLSQKLTSDHYFPFFILLRRFPPEGHVPFLVHKRVDLMRLLSQKTAEIIHPAWSSGFQFLFWPLFFLRTLLFSPSLPLSA